jgi:hypothetical protein
VDVLQGRAAPGLLVYAYQDDRQGQQRYVVMQSGSFDGELFVGSYECVAAWLDGVVFARRRARITARRRLGHVD